MKVWIVGIRDAEANSIIAVCATKEIAEKELFKARDKLIKEWQEMDIFSQKSIKEYCKKKKIKRVWVDVTYKNMIKNLSSKDYKNWQNYPLDTPYLYETEVLESQKQYKHRQSLKT